MLRSLPRFTKTLISLASAIALLPSSTSANPPAPGPGMPGRLHHFEVRAAPSQVMMIPLGEGDRTGYHLRVRLSAGTVRTLKYHGACGRVLLHGSTAERIPSFSPTPAAYGAASGTSRVCGSASCGCQDSHANLIHVQLPPHSLVGETPDVVGQFVPVLPGGDTPQPIMEDAEPGCFGWVEIVADTVGLPTGTQLLATIESYAPNAPRTGPATRVDKLLAAVITP